MFNDKKRKLNNNLIIFFIIIVAIFIALFCYFFNNNNNNNNNTSISANNQKSKHVINDYFNEYYYPQYKDNNNNCGIAKNINTDEKVAISTNDAVCPTEDVLEQNGYKYFITIDNYRPDLIDGACGYAHLVYDSSLLNDKDIIKLKNKLGDLNNLFVNTNNKYCPTVSELSDVIKSPLGIVLHFIYNNIDLNKENYQIINLDNDERILVNKINEDYISLDKDYANIEKYHDMHNEKIPMVYINRESKQLCSENMSDCHYDNDNFYLVNKNTYEEYHLKSHNGYNIPRDMITRKSYNICQGDYLQCDLNSNDNNKLELNNISTGESYIQPDIISVEQQ